MEKHHGITRYSDLQIDLFCTNQLERRSFSESLSGFGSLGCFANCSCHKFRNTNQYFLRKPPFSASKIRPFLILRNVLFIQTAFILLMNSKIDSDLFLKETPTIYTPDTPKRLPCLLLINNTRISRVHLFQLIILTHFNFIQLSTQHKSTKFSDSPRGSISAFPEGQESFFLETSESIGAERRVWARESERELLKPKLGTSNEVSPVSTSQLLLS